MHVFAKHFRVLALGTVLIFASLPHIAIAGTRLVMVTSDYCPFCRAWERDVGAVYDKSPYASALPLTRVDIGSGMPDGVALLKPVVGTPTFLIVRDGKEIERQSGYDDGEMFWWWLSEYVEE